MKVIDLLNKIANGEKLPKKIKYADQIYYLDNEWRGVCYRREDDNRIFEDFFVFENLNDEIEIIEDKPKEDKKIEKLEDFDNLSGIEASGYCLNRIDILLEKGIKENREKLNEIIDYINKENK